MRAQDREEVTLPSNQAGRPASAGSAPGPTALTQEPEGPLGTEASLAHETGVEVKARSQWAYVRMRFFRHKLAVVSLLFLIAIALVAIFAEQIAPYGYDEIPLDDPLAFLEAQNQGPTLKDWHIFGTDQLGRDYLSRIIFGIRTSFWVAVVVSLISTAIGTAVGGIAGYFGGVVDNLLMRFTDLVLTLPGLAVLLTAAQFLEAANPLQIALILAFLFWTGVARIVRGLFLSLREKEFIEAAKAAGASDARIMIRHMLPNTVGPIIVAMTLIVAGAILTEAALSFLGFGIQPPQAALGKLISDGQNEGLRSWWLVTFPGLAITLIALAINFVGDGLRDALDPTQRRVRA
jgi:peptide/nickel transport system permease protein